MGSIPFVTSWIETLHIKNCCYAIEPTNNKYHIIDHLNEEHVENMFSI